MNRLEIRIWRNPIREEITVDGRIVDHDVLLKLWFEDLPMTTTLGELMGTFDHRLVVSRDGTETPGMPVVPVHL
jgi:hypothetical protein